MPWTQKNLALETIVIIYLLKLVTGYNIFFKYSSTEGKTLARMQLNLVLYQEPHTIPEHRVWSKHWA